VLLDLEPEQWLERDALAEVLHEDLAGEAVAPVDAHGVGAADPVRAGAAVGEGAVLVPLHLVEGVQHTVGAFDLNDVFLEVRLLVRLRIEPLDAKRNLHSVPSPAFVPGPANRP